MKASEQLARWIKDDNDLFGTSQDEILKLVFQYPAVPSYKLMLAKWQFLRHGAVEEGLWQQLLLQWPNSAQLFEWRSKSFKFNKEIIPEPALDQEMIPLFSEETITHDQPIKVDWDWGQYLDKMQSPVSFVWEIPEAIETQEIEELPVFEFLLQTETEIEAIPVIEEFQITDDLPIIKDEEIIEQKHWDWASYIEENLDHIYSVWISEESPQVIHVIDKQEVEAPDIAQEETKELSESIPVLEKKDIFLTKSSSMDSTEEFQASAFVKWLQSQKQLEVVDVSQQPKVNYISATVNQEENEELKTRQKKEKIKFKQKDKKKDKKKKKLKKKAKLEEEIFSSLEFSDDVASETYAALLAKQGHFELSERIYERLRLIYPEKSSYFAGLIKKLKS